MKKILLVIGLIFISSTAASAVTNIDTYNRWAWSDAIGWLDLYATTNTPNEVVVGGAPQNKISGSGVFCNAGSNPCSTSTDYLSLDCATSPSGNICTDPAYGATNYFVYNAVSGNDGNLAGWAWNDRIGWVSFCGNTSGGSTYASGVWSCPSSPTYQVKIKDNGSGVRDFSGYAWNDTAGWISFNCDQTGSGGTSTCLTISYKTTTYWGSASVPASGSLTSNTIDTCPSGAASCLGGVAYNYILWKGSLNGGSNSVKFQLATSNCANGATNAPTCNSGGWGLGLGDGSFVGSDGTSATYYATSGPDQPSPITNSFHNNKRYYRYQVFITKTSTATSSPVIKDVIVNWSL